MPLPQVLAGNMRFPEEYTGDSAPGVVSLSKKLLKYLVMVAVITVLYCLDESPHRLVKFVLIGGMWLAFSIPRKCSQRVLTFAGVLLVSFLLFGRDITLSMRTDAAASPFWEVEPPKQQVVLGGQKVFFRAQSLIGTASFYPGDGTMVAMAHACETLSVGQLVGLNITDRSNVISCQAKVLVNAEQGIVVGLPEDVIVKGESIPLGGTMDVSVGEEAVVHSMHGGGTITVRIDGYRMEDGFQQLVVTPVDSADAIIGGMSGSPLVQNGKLIGLVYSRVSVPFQRSNFGMARLAADVYQATCNIAEWDAASSDLVQHDPSDQQHSGGAINVQQHSDEAIKEAHRALVEKHQINLDKFELIEGWEEQYIPYTPAMTGKIQLQACIQDARRQYEHITGFPPLILLDQKDSLLIVGFALEDESTIVVKYDLYASGWHRTVITK